MSLSPNIILLMVAATVPASEAQSQVFQVYDSTTCMGTSLFRFFFTGNAPTDYTTCSAGSSPEATDAKFIQGTCDPSAAGSVSLIAYEDVGCASVLAGHAYDFEEPEAAKLFAGACALERTGKSVKLLTPAPNGGPTCTSPSSVSTSSVSGDPITAYGNKRIEFHLPVGVPHLLYQGEHMKVYASSFPGLFGDQWIERIIVASKSGNKVIEVSIKDDLLQFKSLSVPGEFETLKIDMRLPEPTHLKVIPPAGSYWYIEDLTLTFARQQWNQELRQNPGAPQRECAAIASVTSKIAVCSATAHEYFGYSRAAWEFAHLDIDLVDVDTESAGSTKGVLPELWGLVPLSDRTRSFIVKEWIEENASNHASGNGAVDMNLTGIPAHMFGRTRDGEAAKPLLQLGDRVFPV